MLNKWLFTQIDNSALVVFRIIFGLLISIEVLSAIITGWVRINLIEPQETFNFIGFNFLHALRGNGMIYYYALMGLFGILVMLGYKYRISIIAFTIMWSGVYLMQKSSYNNHYYLLMLLGIIMSLLPANRYASIDSRNNPSLRSISMPRWVCISNVDCLYLCRCGQNISRLAEWKFCFSFNEIQTALLVGWRISSTRMGPLFNCLYWILIRFIYYSTYALAKNPNFCFCSCCIFSFIQQFYISYWNFPILVPCDYTFLFPF